MTVNELLNILAERDIHPDGEVAITVKYPSATEGDTFEITAYDADRDGNVELIVRAN